MSPLYEFLILLCCHLIILLLVAAGDGNAESHREGGECPASFDCGPIIGDISFPFTTAERADCGLLPIQNCHEEPLKPRMIQLQNNGKRFLVIRNTKVTPTPTSATIQIRDNDFYELLQTRSCEAFRKNYTLPPTFHFASFSMEFNATLFRCNRNASAPTNMRSYTNCSHYDLYYSNSSISEGNRGSLAACTKVQLPIKDVPDANDPFTFITADFLIQVQLSEECADCHYKKRGQCQLDSQSKFYCAIGSTSTSRSWVVMKIALALGLAVTVTAVLVMVMLCYIRRSKKNPKHLLVDAFLERHGHLQIKRYSYSEIKKMTNSLRNKLGQGGFGRVYKGQLQDGRHVAVKILSELKGDGEDFINEVASMSRTSHVNIVALLGFCFDGSKQALVYEFMSNGSLEKFIYGDNDVTTGHQLDYQALYDIAIGVARGLEYLHRGCNTRILHFDIKPHNILLDENFCPKISDFGLAKVCTRKESLVSIFGARGTAGYIAPEVFSRNFGVVSRKSDVYSYGMMVLEMVGRRKNIKVEVEASSEIYFPYWIYNRLALNQELGMHDIKDEIDDEKVRKMTIVSLWCIQTNPSTRPSMTRVVEMLEGRVELQLPPKPVWFSPSGSPDHLSCE